MGDFRLVGTIHGNSPYRERYVVTSDATVEDGDAVTISNGTITKATATSSTLLGVVCEGVTGDGTLTAEVIIDPFAIYEVACEGTPTSANLIETCDIAVTSTVQYADIDASTYDPLRLIAPIRPNGTDTYTTVKVMLNKPILLQPTIGGVA